MIALSGKTALVTGAARRIGRAVALDLARSGMNLVVHYCRSGDEAGALVERIRSSGKEAWAVQADLGDPNAAAGLLTAAIEQSGQVDALINSASIFDKSAVADFTWDDLEENMRVNAFAPLELCRRFAAQTETGAVVNLLDTRVSGPDPVHAAYHLSKRTLYALTRMLAWEMAPKIRVNGVAPGLILPPPGEDDSYLLAHQHENPLTRVGTPEGVAEAVRFLLTSDFVTGQVIYVDGGRHMRGSFY